MSVTLDGKSLTLNDIEKISYQKEKVILSAEIESKLLNSIKVINEKIKNREIVYGINTGFGKLSDTQISESKINELQLNLLRSHAVGVGEPLEETVTRALMLIRVNNLINGFSGIKHDTVKLLTSLINNNIYPYIPDTGSLGASGDLAPLSHLSLLLIGEGRGFIDKEIFSGADILKNLNEVPLNLGPKEGLALINGTAVSSGLFAIDLLKIRNIITASICASILSIEAFCGRRDAFTPGLHKLKPHPGQLFIADIIYNSLSDSNLSSENYRVQDPYSFRCIPQVIGPVIDCYFYCKNVLEIEINSVTDNPIIFTDNNRIISGGNFHAEPIALASDYLCISSSIIGEISERRINNLLDGNLNGGIPAFLTNDPGINSGFMIMQYTDSALVSKNRVMSYPSSLTSIPVSANQEDFVSQSLNSALKLSKIIENLNLIISIELLVASQALEFREKKNLGKTGNEIYNLIRKFSAPLTKDRSMTDDIGKISELIINGEFKKILPSCEVL